MTTTDNEDTQGPPEEVTNLMNAVSAIPGIAAVDLRKTYLPDIEVDDLSLPGFYADLPIAALRRSNGGLPDELLLTIEFLIERNEAGLKALEFLSWWVRDRSRGGENMQIRSIGLPPIAGEVTQLGTTLRFAIEWFHADPSMEMPVLLAAIAEMTEHLTLCFNLYRSAF